MRSFTGRDVRVPVAGDRPPDAGSSKRLISLGRWLAQHVLKHAYVPLSGCYHDFVDRSVERERWTGDGDEIVVLHGVSWTDYFRRMRERGDAAQPRMAYLDGNLEIVTRGTKHERLTFQIGRLLEVYMLENDIEFTGYGEWTQRSRKQRAGAEADTSYVLSGDHSHPERYDLAIEVIVSSGGVDKLEIYRRIGVKEVWFWRDGTIEMYVLARGRYRRVKRSFWMPRLDVELLLSFLDVRPSSSAIRAYRKALQARRG